MLSVHPSTLSYPAPIWVHKQRLLRKSTDTSKVKQCKGKRKQHNVCTGWAGKETHLWFFGDFSRKVEDSTLPDLSLKYIKSSGLAQKHPPCAELGAGYFGYMLSLYSHTNPVYLHATDKT